MKRITVLLAEDFALLREAFRALLAGEDDIEVIGEAATGREAVNLARKLSPDVVVMDISMPILNGWEATRQIRNILPSTKVLMLSAHNNATYVAQAIAQGAAGYVTKQTSSEVLSSAIRNVHKGNTVFNPRLFKSIPDCVRNASVGPDAFVMTGTELTTREAEVLQLVAEGKPNKQIAGEIGICAKTVEKHRGSLMQKLNIHDTAGLTRYAVSKGIVEIEADAPQPVGQSARSPLLGSSTILVLPKPPPHLYPVATPTPYCGEYVGS